MLQQQKCHSPEEKHFVEDGINSPSICRSSEPHFANKTAAASNIAYIVCTEHELERHPPLPTLACEYSWNLYPYITSIVDPFVNLRCRWVETCNTCTCYKRLALKRAQFSARERDIF